MAQTKQIRGRVVDENSEAVIGASVVVVGTTVGVTTDLNGEFLIRTVPSNAKELSISFLGYKEKVVPIAAQVEVQLESDAQAVEAVTVVSLM